MTFTEEELRLLAQLADLLGRLDPVPPEVLAAALRPAKP
jgi:hypothetical protein